MAQIRLKLRKFNKNQLTQSDSALNADKNGHRTMVIRCIFTELLQCKVQEKMLQSALFLNFEVQFLRKDASVYRGSSFVLVNIQCIIPLYKLILIELPQFLTNLSHKDSYALRPFGSDLLEDLICPTSTFSLQT